MMGVNASITSWKQAGVPMGDGRPGLGPELVPAPNRPFIASLIAPGSHAVQTALAKSIKLDLILQVNPSMLIPHGVDPKVGDRLTINHRRPTGNTEIRVEITEVKPDFTAGMVGSAGITTLGLKVVRDGV